MPRERIDRAKVWDDLAYENFKESGLEVVHYDRLSLDIEDALDAVRVFRDQKVDCIIYLIGTWVYVPQVVAAIKEARLPSVILCPPDSASFSLTATGIIHGSLDEVGLQHKIVYGSPEDIGVKSKVVRYAKASMVVRRLRGSKFGMIGGKAMGMYTTTTDMMKVAEIFGVEYEHVDQHRLILEAQKVSDEETEKILVKIKKRFGRIEPSHDVLMKSAKLYLALKKIIAEDQYDFVAVKCMPEVANAYTSCCLAVSLTNDDGATVACECDVNGALTMEILRLLTGQPALFADLNLIYPDKGVVKLVNCGTAPTRLAKSLKDVDLGLQYEYLSEKGGATTIFCCKPGRVTLARLARIKGQYVMHIATGEAFEQPKVMFKEAREKWPHAFIKLDGDAERFVQNCRSNHMHMSYGDLKDELIEVCEILQIKPIIT
jgi:L-fucose isomerase